MGNYLLAAFARDGVTGVEVSATRWYSVSSLHGVALQASPAAPQRSGVPITLTAAATGGSNVQYQFCVYNPTATPAWSEVQGYSASATCTWTPAVPGDYLLSVTAQDGLTGVEVSTTRWYSVTNSPLTGVTLQANPPSPKMKSTPITLTAAAKGGTGVQYQFWLYIPPPPRRGACCKAIPPRRPARGRPRRGATISSPPPRRTGLPARKRVRCSGISCCKRWIQAVVKASEWRFALRQRTADNSIPHHSPNIGPHPCPPPLRQGRGETVNGNRR